jgi:molybdate transport system substrate-binding protein
MGINPFTGHSRRPVLAGIAATFAAATAVIAQEAALIVFAAASLKDSMDQAGLLFAARTKNQPRFSYGASSALARQIEQGAPADVFVSADVDWMDYLSKRHLIIEASRRSLFSNHLALIAPANSKISLRMAKGMPLAAALGGGRLAIAGPEVPAGRYGRAALASLGVWPEVQDHLAPAENVRAALAFVARNETPLGIVYDTDAKVELAVKIVGLFPDNSHPAILYPGAVLASSKNPNAGTFLDSLSKPPEAGVFKKFGFQVLNP